MSWEAVITDTQRAASPPTLRRATKKTQNSRDAGAVDDARALLEVRQRGARHVHVAAGVGLEGALDLLVAEVGQRLAHVLLAGVVDKDVEAALFFRWVLGVLCVCWRSLITLAPQAARRRRPQQPTKPKNPYRGRRPSWRRRPCTSWPRRRRRRRAGTCGPRPVFVCGFFGDKGGSSPIKKAHPKCTRRDQNQQHTDRQQQTRTHTTQP